MALLWRCCVTQVGVAGLTFGGGVEATFKVYIYAGSNRHKTIATFHTDGDGNPIADTLELSVEGTCMEERPNYIGGRSYDFTLKAKAQVCLTFIPTFTFTW